MHKLCLYRYLGHRRFVGGGVGGSKRKRPNDVVGEKTDMFFAPKVPFNSFNSQKNVIQFYTHLYKDLKNLSPTLLGSNAAFCLNSRRPAFLSVDCARKEDKEDFKTELEIMKVVKAHPNVVRLLGCCTVKGYFDLLLILE